MQAERPVLRVADPGVRALFSEESRFQTWLGVEAALAQAQAELGVIPRHAADEITRKAKLSYLDLDAIHAGLARTGHPLVPLIGELDRVCEGDAGGYLHWGAHHSEHHADRSAHSPARRPPHLPRAARRRAPLPGYSGRRDQRRAAARPNARPARRAGHVRIQGGRLDRRALPARRAPPRMRAPGLRSHVRRWRGHAGVGRGAWRSHAGQDGRAFGHGHRAHARTDHRRSPCGVRHAAGPARGHLLEDRTGDIHAHEAGIRRGRRARSGGHRGQQHDAAKAQSEAVPRLSNYLKMARRHCRRNHRSAHASCNTPR